MSSSPAAAPTRARSVNGPLPQLLVGPGRLASPDVADPSPAAPRWLRLVPVRVVFLVVLALAVLLGAGLVRAVVRALTAPLGHWPPDWSRTGGGRLRSRALSTPDNTETRHDASTAAEWLGGPLEDEQSRDTTSQAVSIAGQTAPADGRAVCCSGYLTLQLPADRY